MVSGINRFRAMTQSELLLLETYPCLSDGLGLGPIAIPGPSAVAREDDVVIDPDCVHWSAVTDTCHHKMGEFGEEPFAPRTGSCSG